MHNMFRPVFYHVFAIFYFVYCTIFKLKIMKKKTIARRKKRRLRNSEGGKNSTYAQKKALQKKGIYSSASPFRVVNSD